MNIPHGLLRNGAHGKLVTDLQKELKQAGFSPGTIDGSFGAHTQAAVARFQHAKGLKADGIVGPQTWKALGGDRFEHARGAAAPAHHAPAHHAPSRTTQSAGSHGAGRLFGADTSMWQSNAQFQRSIAGAKFTVVRATDGHTYNDPTFHQRWNELGQKIHNGSMKLRVAYHYLEPGDGVGQAKHFLQQVGVHGKLQPGTRLALDWEGKALSSPQTLHDAAKYIHGVTGIWPLVYTSASNVPTARRAAPQAPLWEAKWTGGLSVHNAPFVQYSDGPGYDHDVFNGSLAALEKFAGW